MMTMPAVLLALSLAAGPELPTTPFAASDGKAYVLKDTLAASRFTVLVFFAHTCPIMRAHDARVIALAQKYAEKGVRVLLVDSEADATAERAAKDAAERHYPFPILVDADGALAHALGVRFATTAVVLEAGGKVRYRGGIDADKQRLRPESPFYLADALDAVLAGGSPKESETKALGCVLRFK